MTIRNQVTYQTLISAEDPFFDDFFQIYSESIELREQKPRAVIAKMVRRTDYKIVLQIEKGSAVGFSILFAPAGENFCLLEYMAVESAHRNSGLGGQLFRRTMEHSVSSEGIPLPALLEVDSDREISAGQEMRKRRLQFYRRLGCLRVEGLSYILPLAADGRVPEMFLLISAPGNFPAIQKPQLEHWLGVIYQSVYNCAPNDPRISTMLKSVSDPVKLA